MNLYFDTMRDLLPKAHAIATATGHEVSLALNRAGGIFSPVFLTLSAAEARAMAAELTNAADVAERLDERAAA